MHFLLYLLMLFIIGCAAKCGYESCHPVVNNKLNVHLIPHSHDDLGWLKNVDQYFYGSRIDLHRTGGVKYIIDSVIRALKQNPDRRFIQVEASFFWQWWKEQSEDNRKAFKDLVENGQMEIVGGGWCMNDEAATNYQSIIDQFTIGLRVINDTLGECGKPKIGWQIDAFGHSLEMASIFAQLGYDAILTPRIDFRDILQRQSTREVEMIWRGSPDLGKSADIFTSIMYRYFNAPPKFCWDMLCKDDPIIDNTRSTEYNAETIVNEFTAYIEKQRHFYTTPNILIPMGGDFNYQQAPMYFKNIDKLIKAFKIFKDEEYNLIYSTPSCYIKAVNDYALSNNLNYTHKTDDFMPYATAKHSYWTGYYTSRPNSKRFERQGNNFLQVTKQLTSFAGTTGNDYSEDVVDLKEIMGIMQHHDAITGTERQDVSQDYVRWLTRGINIAHTNIQSIISDLLLKNEGHSPPEKLSFESCLQANVSRCEPSKSDRFVVAVYNPLGHTVSHYVRLPVTASNHKIVDPDGNLVPSQMARTIETFPDVGGVEPSSYELVWYARNIGPLGLKLFYVSKEDAPVAGLKLVTQTYGTTSFGTYETNFEIDKNTGFLNTVTLNNISMPVKQEFLFYRASNGSTNGEADRASGAYVFRPAVNFPTALPVTDKAVVKTYTGVLFDEVHQQFSDYIKQIIRVYKEENHIEFDWVIGPLEYREHLGVEVISRFTTNLNTEKTFYTDSNGRGLVRRIRNFRETYAYTNEEPVSANYYPVTSRIVIKDRKQNLEMAVLNDRAQGGSSIQDGEIELMLHRRLMNDDYNGLWQVLDEIEFGKGVVVRGQHYLVLANNEGAASRQHELVQRKHLTPWIFVANATLEEHSLQNLEEHFNFKFSGLTRDLPKNIHLLTLEQLKKNTLLLRLEHMFAKNEDDKLSQSVTVDLQGLFALFKITTITETTLGGNELLKDNHKLKWTGSPFMESQDTGNVEDGCLNDLKVTLHPMQIRTFIINIEIVKK